MQAKKAGIILYERRAFIKTKVRQADGSGDVSYPTAGSTN